MTERQEEIDAWQGYLRDIGIPTFPLFGITNGKCRCTEAEHCRNPGKHPKIKGWRHLQESVQARALDNIGASTDRLVVIDIDTGLAIPEDLPETLTISTGRGLHLWYWANPEHAITNAVNWRPKIDIRSVGGLVAVPPSVHVSGSVYTYVGGEIQPVPSLVLETQRAYVQRERKPQITSVPSETSDMMRPLLDGLVAEAGSAAEGERNHTLFRVLCRFFELAEAGWAGRDGLEEICAAAYRNGLSVVEIKRTVDSASRSLTR